jgi:hypothetical protein
LRKERHQTPTHSVPFSGQLARAVVRQNDVPRIGSAHTGWDESLKDLMRLSTFNALRFKTKRVFRQPCIPALGWRFTAQEELGFTCARYRRRKKASFATGLFRRAPPRAARAGLSDFPTRLRQVLL